MVSVPDDRKRARIYSACARLQDLGVPPGAYRDALTFADSLCEHEWSEWSYATSQEGARYCTKCGRRQFG